MTKTVAFYFYVVAELYYEHSKVRAQDPIMECESREEAESVMAHHPKMANEVSRTIVEGEASDDSAYESEHFLRQAEGWYA